jgi:hypothetical protein
MPENGDQYMHCMEVWGGSQLTARTVRLAGLDAWVYSKPFGDAGQGGDVYYASSCATGRISRLLLADVSGHGDVVATTAGDLRSLMRQYVNFLDQTEFVRSMNRQFVTMSAKGGFATAVATTFFAPNLMLSVCNAGHPRPLYYRAKDRRWSILELNQDSEPAPNNIPLGILDVADYEQFDVELGVGDLVVCYTDALIESRDADGEFLGEEGLLRIAESVDAARGEEFIGSLLGKISQRHEKNLLEDDVTVLVLRPSVGPRRVGFGERFGAMLRMVGETVQRIFDRSGERPPLPDWSVANIGGAIIPSLGRKWRPKHRQKGGSKRKRPGLPISEGRPPG